MRDERDGAMNNGQLIWTGCGCALLGVLARLCTSGGELRQEAGPWMPLGVVVFFVVVGAIILLSLAAVSATRARRDPKPPSAPAVHPPPPSALPRATVVHRDKDKATRQAEPTSAGRGEV